MKKTRTLLPLIYAAALRLRTPAVNVGSAAILVSALSAQTITTGDISGAVNDASGAVVSGATVTLKSTDTGETRTQTSSGSGEYRFTTLRPGRYQVSVESPGLTSKTVEVPVAIGQIQTLNLVLEVQATKEVVQVTESVPLLQSDNANLATSYDLTQIENLPAPGNDMTAYAFSAPGVTISTAGGYGNFSAFGLPGVSNLFTINGVDNMDPYLNLNNSGASNLTLGSNEIAEVAVVLNGYTGQYGRQAGANVNYVTKSGTNSFHGNAGWWYNDRVLNANDFFNNSSGTPRPRAISNEWVDSIGGPVKKDKLFFFVDNEGLRYVLPGGGPVYIPTQAFSNFVLNNVAATTPSALPLYQQALKLYAGSSGAARATPLDASFDPKLGCGDFAGNGPWGVSEPCAETFRSTVNNLNTEWLMAARVDYAVTSNDRLFFRYNTDHGVQATGTDPINSAFNANSVQPSYGGQMGWTRTMGASSVNQFIAAASYYTALFGPPNLKTALSTFPTTIAFADGAPYNNLGGSDQDYPSGRKVRQWQVVDDYSFTLGSHNLGFGANVRKNFVSTYAYGSQTSGLLTFNSMTDFVNGYFGAQSGSTYVQNFTNIGAEPLAMYSAGFYGQDQWKVRPNLTVTLAVRFDRNSNIHCYSGCFNELAGQPFAQAAHSASTPYDQSIQTGLKEAFPSVEPLVTAPRLGVAWNVAPHTVIRAGAGLFSDLYQALLADRLVTNSPAVASFSTSSGTVAFNDPNSIFAAVTNSYNAFASGFASGATLSQLTASVPGFSPPNFNTVSTKLRNPKEYEWNFEFQQQLSNALMLSVNYVGNHGFQLNNQTLFSNEYSSTGFAGLPTTAPDPRFGEVREFNNNGYSNYDGVVTSLRWRLSSAFSGNVSYTWSHDLDTCSNECLEPFNTLTAPSLRYQISPSSLGSGINYSNSDYDIRHSLNMNYVYTVPTSYFHNGVLKSVLGGWTAAGTLYFKTGYPFSVIDSSVRGAQNVANASGIAPQTFLAEYLGSPISATCTSPSSACLSTSMFADASAQTTFGNLARNSFRGPNYFDTDLNLSKTISLKERLKLLIGANFFNILNHPNFDLPGNNVTEGNFGQITSTVSAPTSAYGSFVGSDVSGRVIQTEIKLTF